MGLRATSLKRTADIADVCAGVLLITCAFMPWLRRGPGSSLAGHELVDTLLSLRRAAPTGAIALSVFWYLIPLCGALTLLRVGATASRAAVFPIALTALIATTSCAVLIWRAVGIGDADLGFVAAALGCATLTLTECAMRFSSRSIDTRSRVRRVSAPRHLSSWQPTRSLGRRDVTA